jgi:serine/threonine protein kinase
MLEPQMTHLNQYAIQSRLARGGMSEIYLAHDEQQHTVAIKVVHTSNDDYVARFHREVATLKSLAHEHILPIFDFGEQDCWHYCVMPYAKHGTLRERIAEGPLTQQETGAILEQVAAALQHAHDHNFLHRDIKPSNILFKDEHQVYLADFGLAKEIVHDSALTQTGSLMGTPEYMAPELAEEPATTSSDIYALGIVLYQMLTGKVPFQGSNPLSIYWKHIRELPIPPSLLNPAISYAVERVVLRALEKEPQRRFKSVQEMAQAYTQALQNIVILSEAKDLSLTPGGIKLAPPTTRVIPIQAVYTRSSRRRVHPALIALVAVFFLMVIPFALGLSLSSNNVSIQASTIRGANAQFVAKLLPPLQVTKTTPVPNSGNHPDPPRGNGHGSGGGHGHKHKHGHADGG